MVCDTRELAEKLSKHFDWPGKPSDIEEWMDLLARFELEITNEGIEKYKTSQEEAQVEE